MSVWDFKVLAESDGIYGVILIVPGIGRRPDYSVSDRLVQLGLARHAVERGRIIKGRLILFVVILFVSFLKSYFPDEATDATKNTQKHRRN